jgi:hypothetical protein
MAIDPQSVQALKGLLKQLSGMLKDHPQAECGQALKAALALARRLERQARMPEPSGALHCSFCGKSQEAVQKLISAPATYPRAYICDECIMVCNSILDDDSAPIGRPRHAGKKG